MRCCGGGCATNVTIIHLEGHNKDQTVAERVHYCVSPMMRNQDWEAPIVDRIWGIRIGLWWVGQVWRFFETLTPRLFQYTSEATKAALVLQRSNDSVATVNQFDVGLDGGFFTTINLVND